MPLRQPAQIALSREADGDAAGGMPRPHEQNLIERSTVEAAEPPCGLGAESSLGRRARLETVPEPLVGGWRNHDPVEVKWDVEALALSHDVEFHTVAAL